MNARSYRACASSAQRERAARGPTLAQENVRGRNARGDFACRCRRVRTCGSRARRASSRSASRSTTTTRAARRTATFSSTGSKSRSPAVRGHVQRYELRRRGYGVVRCRRRRRRDPDGSLAASSAFPAERLRVPEPHFLRAAHAVTKAYRLVRRPVRARGRPDNAPRCGSPAALFRRRRRRRCHPQS